MKTSLHDLTISSRDEARKTNVILLLLIGVSVPCQGCKFSSMSTIFQLEFGSYDSVVFVFHFTSPFMQCGKA